jgi:L-alanine-DL-glutamate epimerase-like enolase superfamily enzyme
MEGKMKIKDVRGFDLRTTLEEPFEWPDGRAFERTAGVVRVETNEGLVGWGPADYGCAALVERRTIRTKPNGTP